MKFTPNFNGLKAPEYTRYEVRTEDNGAVVGYISSRYYDSRTSWYMWNEQGLYAEVRNLKDAKAQWQQMAAKRR